MSRLFFPILYVWMVINAIKSMNNTLKKKYWITSKIFLIYNTTLKTIHYNLIVNYKQFKIKSKNHFKLFQIALRSWPKFWTFPIIKQFKLANNNWKTKYFENSFKCPWNLYENQSDFLFQYKRAKIWLKAFKNQRQLKCSQ